MLRSILATAILWLTAFPAAAEVVARHADGFTLRYAVALETTADDVRGSLADLPSWWDPAHTYTGEATRLSMTLEPGGCWCETLADGTVFRHATVISVDPEHQAVLHAPLGPLHETATRADLTYRWAPENKGWLISVDFVVEGPGLGAAADAVDTVMQGGFDRFVRYVEYGEALP